MPVTDTCHLSLAEYCDERVCLSGDHISGTVRPKHLQPLNRSDAVLFVNSGGPKKSRKVPGSPRGKDSLFRGGLRCVNIFRPLVVLQLELSVVYKTSQATEVSEATTFMPVEVPTRGHQAVAVCVQATYGHLSRERVVEWLEMQRLLGVSLIGVYLTPRTHAGH